MKKLKIALILIVFISTISTTLLASSIIDTTLKGTLTIRAKSIENETNLSSETAIKGVEYTLYAVPETVETIEAAEVAITDATAIVVTDGIKVTDENGLVVYENLELGRYYAKVTGIPAEASKFPESFLVDVPMTNDAGDSWVYDITVTPKVNTAYGDVKLTNLDEKGAPLANIEFTLQVKTDKTDWIDYKVCTTDSNGEISVSGLPIRYTDEEIATYRFVQTGTLPEEYIINNKYLDTITVNSNGTVNVTNARTSEVTTSDIGEITVINEKLTVTKKINNLDSASIGINDKVTMSVTIDLPSKDLTADMSTIYVLNNTPYCVFIDTTSLVIKGILRDDQNTVEEIRATRQTISSYNCSVTLTPANIAKYSTIIIEYSGEYNANKNVTIGGVGNEATTTLKYTNKINLEGTEETTVSIGDSVTVFTGGIKIQKVDKSDNTKVLEGAEFKIATKNADGSVGEYLKDSSGSELVLVTDEDGLIEQVGIAYEDDGTARDYYLVETKAPTYIENVDGQDVEMSYTLLKAPLKVSIGEDSYDTAIVVKNAKRMVLPATGGIGIVIFAIAGISVMAVAIISNKKQQVKE